MALNTFAVALLVNGAAVNFGPVPADLKPSLENGVIVVPVRQVMEAVGAKVDYEFPRMVYVTYKGKRLEVSDAYWRRLNSVRNTFYPKLIASDSFRFLRETSYAEAEKLDGPGDIYGNNRKEYRLFLPLGFLADTFKLSLKWNAKRKVVQIRTRP